MEHSIFAAVMDTLRWWKGGSSIIRLLFRWCKSWRMRSGRDTFSFETVQRASCCCCCCHLGDPIQRGILLSWRRHFHWNGFFFFFFSLSWRFSRENNTRAGITASGAEAAMRINRLRRPNSETLLSSCAVGSALQQDRCRKSSVSTINGHPALRPPSPPPPPGPTKPRTCANSERDATKSSSITYL